jgi:3',5'-cyclic AMP phosphodiesterase CpdA
MRKTTYRLLIICILVSISTIASNAQTYLYDAFIKGHNVGLMTVDREVNDESEKISVISHIKAHMLVTIRVEFESNATYMDGALVEAEAVSKTNGHLHSKATTILKNGKYQADVDGKSKQVNGSKLIGGDMFYFEEPTSIKEVYSLASGGMLDVISDANHEYHFEHDGKKELHKYSNGVLTEMRLEHKLYTVIFKLQK